MSDAKTCGECRYGGENSRYEGSIFCENPKSHCNALMLTPDNTCPHWSPKQQAAGISVLINERDSLAVRVIELEDKLKDVNASAPTLAKENEELRAAIQNAINEIVELIDIKDDWEFKKLVENLADALTKKEVDDGK